MPNPCRRSGASEPARAERLAELGIATVEDLARADPEPLARAFGPTIGPSLKVLGLGGDQTPIDGTPYVARSRGKEVTFEHDLTARAEIEAAHRATGHWRSRSRSSPRGAG